MRQGIHISRPLKILTDDELYQLHVASVRTLEKTGYMIEHMNVLEKLENMGSEVDYRTKIAKIPEQLVMEMLGKVPTKITFCGRKKDNDIALERGHSFATSTGASVYVVSPDGKYREGTTKDVERFARLANALDNIDLTNGMIESQEIPHELRDIYTASTMLNNTEKHYNYVTHGSEGARAIIRMAAAIVGDEDRLRERPIVSGAAPPSPPFYYDKTALDIFLEWVKHGLPVRIGSLPISGATAPVTLAGTIVENNVDCLASIVISQVVNPGTPVLMGGLCANLDMRTGTLAQASPEQALMAVCVIQLAHYYGLPVFVFTGMTNAKIPDGQMGYEKVVSTLLPLLAGPNVHFAAGNLSSAIATAYEQLVIDNEILGMLRRIAEGIEINQVTLAIDVMEKVGPRGHFLEQKHTLEHFKKEHWIPLISERRSVDGWRADGAKDIVRRAEEYVQEILSAHQPEPLSEEIKKEIDHVVKDAERKIRCKR